MSFLNLQTFVGKTQKFLAVEEEKSCSVVGSLLLVEMKLCLFCKTAPTSIINLSVIFSIYFKPQGITQLWYFACNA